MASHLEQAKSALAVADEVIEKLGPEAAVHLADQARTLALLSIAESLADIRTVLYDGTVTVRWS